MNRNVYIRKTKQQNFFILIDCLTKNKWANEIFHYYEEAVKFCTDNNLVIQEHHVIEAKINEDIDVKFEDGGQAMIIRNGLSDNEEENGMFVKLQSWDENKEHKVLKKFVGRNIRITIETID